MNLLASLEFLKQRQAGNFCTIVVNVACSRKMGVPAIFNPFASRKFTGNCEICRELTFTSANQSQSGKKQSMRPIRLCQECAVILSSAGHCPRTRLLYFVIRASWIVRVKDNPAAPNLSEFPRPPIIEIVTAECAFGISIFKDLFAGVRNIVGGRSKAVQQTMRDARRTALYELKVEANLVGANAVVGVDLDYVELSAGGSMVMLVASGTAVVIES